MFKECSRHCGAIGTAEIDRKYCYRCGATLKEQAHCKQCERLLNEVDAFCSYCGKKVEAT